MAESGAVQRIVVRLPNWLGDLVMSTAFLRSLCRRHPNAQIEVIVKQGIDGVVDYMPGIHRKHVFSKTQWPGLRGAWRFGKMIAKQDVAISHFYCLPDSFSSAVMARATGARHRTGFANEMRGFLLTQVLQKPRQLHRVEQYMRLLAPLPADELPRVYLENRSTTMPHRIVVNVNSEADSRRLPVAKAVAILNRLRANTTAEIVLVGSPKEVPHVASVCQLLQDKTNVINLAGTTNLHQLMEILGSAPVMLTTDSGPMHLANALGVHTVALEGASDERNTAPYNAERRTLIRYGQLPCEPCVKNTCQFGEPRCLISINEEWIVEEVLTALKNSRLRVEAFKN